MSIVVTTPTGNIGHIVVDRLLEAGADVAVIARKPEKLAPSVRERVTVFEGELGDAALVERATKGAEALFWLTPADFTTSDWKAVYARSAEVGSNAVRANKIPYVVNLSSAGAEHTQGFGPISYVQLVENALAETGANVLQLRPGFFYENFLGQLDAIAQGALYEPCTPDVTWPMIATRDIGVVAAKKLLERSWSGVSILGLHGPDPTPSFGEAADILGKAIGRPVQFTQVPVEAILGQLRQRGVSESVVAGYGELLTMMSKGISPAEPRTPETTTPTTLLEWATEVLRPLVEAKVG